MRLAAALPTCTGEWPSVSTLPLPSPSSSPSRREDSGSRSLTPRLAVPGAAEGAAEDAVLVSSPEGASAMGCSGPADTPKTRGKGAGAGERDGDAFVAPSADAEPCTAAEPAVLLSEAEGGSGAWGEGSPVAPDAPAAPDADAMPPAVDEVESKDAPGSLLPAPPEGERGSPDVDVPAGIADDAPVPLPPPLDLPDDLLTVRLRAWPSRHRRSNSSAARSALNRSANVWRALASGLGAFGGTSAPAAAAAKGSVAVKEKARLRESASDSAGRSSASGCR